MSDSALGRLVVIDTNVLVSALISPQGQPLRVIAQVFQEQITPCYDQDILEEYIAVLYRPKFAFEHKLLKKFLQEFQNRSYYVFAENVDSSAVLFTDESDRKFYDLAVSCKAQLITGNKRDYPVESWIVSPTEFLDQCW